MLAYILSLGFVLKFGFVSCSISGAIKKSHQVNGRSRGTFFKFRNAGYITSKVGEDLLSTPSEENHLIKRTLLDIRHGVNLSRDKQSLLRQAKKQKRRPEPFSKIRQLHHQIDIRAEKRESILKGINDTARKNCKFPFIYDEKTRYTCLDNASDGKKWCSLTSNYDRDLRWMDCPPPVNTPFKRSENMNFRKIPKKSKAEKAKTGDVNQNSKVKGEPSDEICDTCDNLPKNTTDAAVQSMQDEIDDVDKSDKTIHAIVSNEVDNFIGTILAKHGVPDTEQQELLALNAKLSTELAKEVSCKIGDTNIGSGRSDCESSNSTLGIGKKNKHNFKTNGTSVNETVHTKSTTNAISPNVVDNFIVALLAQHGVAESKQKDALASRLKTSTDIADQISYVLANANAGIKNNQSVKTASHTRAKTVFNIDKENDTNIHAKVDTFLGSVLAEHGVSSREQKDILAWNAQLSTDIANQVGSIVDNADIGSKPARNDTKTREEQKIISKLLQSQLKSPEQLQTQIKASAQNTSKLGVADTKNISRNAVAKVDPSSNEREMKQLPDTLQPIYRETDSENDTSVPEHKEKEKVPVAGTLQAFTSIDTDDTDAHVIHETDDAKENKNYDDISPDNDMETGSDDMSFQTENDKLSSDAEEEDRGIAPDVVDTVPESEETISPFKIQYNGDNDENNITAFAHKEFNRKPQIHSKKSRSHKRITGDENWDKYLMDDGWMPKSNSNHEKREDANKDFSGEREQLNEEEKTMINYVSDSIIESVKNVKHPLKGSPGNRSEGSGNDLVTYKKLDSGKKPYLIYRVKQSKNDFKKPPGVDALDSKTQKIIPGAKNINIIIINNRNNTLDLNDIENTIAHSSETLATFNSSQPTIETATTTATSNITLLNKTDENVNQIYNITKETPSLLNNSSNIILDNASYKNNTPSISNNTSMNFSNSTIAKITFNTPNTIKMKHETNNNINESEFDIDRKFNESKEYLQQSDGKTDKNVSFSKLLVEYDKNSESTALQSLRKSGLISMNYAPEEIEIKTFGGNAKGKKCMFPFIYDGVTYFNCINTNKDEPWCSVRANYDKLPEWGYCNDEQLADDVRRDGKPTSNEVQAQRQQQLAEMVHNQGEEVVSKHSGMKTFGGNANGARCVMPFVYDGQTHESCIPRSDGTAWCAASHSYDIHPVWGNCCDNEIYKC